MNSTAIFLITFLGATLLCAVLFLIIEIYAVVIGHIKGAPFVRSSRKKIKIMLELAEIKPGQKVYDLGSGDGSLLVETARLGALATGLEINPFLVMYSRWRIRRAGLADKTEIIKTDLRKYPLDDADIVFLYLWPETIEKLKEKLIKELKPSALVISNAFKISGWRPLAEKEHVYIYRV